VVDATTDVVSALVEVSGSVVVDSEVIVVVDPEVDGIIPENAAHISLAFCSRLAVLETRETNFIIHRQKD
jgi:hypothetical protein